VPLLVTRRRTLEWLSLLIHFLPPACLVALLVVVSKAKPDSSSTFGFGRHNLVIVHFLTDLIA
jgi:hypothetical protein